QHSMTAFVPQQNASNQAITIADITLQCLSADDKLVLFHAAELSSFRIGGAQVTPDISINVNTGSIAMKDVPQKAFDSGGVWKFYKDGSDLVFHFETPLLPNRPYRMVRFREGFESGDLILERTALDGKGSVDPLEHPLDQLVVSGFLATGKGVLLHS